MTSKERCLAALAGGPVDRAPVFPLLMFFAASRAGRAFRRFATDGAALAAAQVHMHQRFGIDAITARSDAFRLAADLGAEMAYPDDKPPYAVTALIAGPSDLNRIGRPDPLAAGSRMADRCAGISLISPELYRQFALPYEERVCAAIRRAGALVKLHICGNITALLADLPQSGADLFNVDHLVDFDAACGALGKTGHCFKGNLDPVGDLLHATPQSARAKARCCIRRARRLPYMLSAGCEIPAAVSDEVFEAFCTASKIEAASVA